MITNPVFLANEDVVQTMSLLSLLVENVTLVDVLEQSLDVARILQKRKQIHKVLIAVPLLVLFYIRRLELFHRMNQKQEYGN